MVVTINGERSLRRYRLVVAQKSRLRLVPEVPAAFASHGRDHRLTASGFFPCSIDREYLYGYAADGYRSPLWLCASHTGGRYMTYLNFNVILEPVFGSQRVHCLGFFKHILCPSGAIHH